MCRNIKQLHNFEPPATEDEIRASAIQFVRKISGYNKPSAANPPAFDPAIDKINTAAKKLLDSLTTSAIPKNRETERQKAKERNRRRFSVS